MKTINRIATLALAAAAFSNAAAQQVSFSGSSMAIVEDAPAASTGLDRIYVLYDSDGVSMNFSQRNAGAAVTWYAYEERGGAYAEPITEVVRLDPTTTQLPQVRPNCGYIIEEGTDRTYLWVFDYSDYRLAIDAISVDPVRDCGTTRLIVDGSGPDMTYYTITGVPQQLDRGITLQYRTLEWNADDTAWREVELTSNEERFSTSIAVPAPYCDTQFTLSGDRFLQAWGMEESVTSDTFTTSAVAAETTAVQEQREAENERNDGNDESAMGGSAPVTITFTAYCTDAVVHNEWQMSHDQDFNEIEDRFSQTEITQTFNEAGTYYFRFCGADNSGECETYGETYTVFIGESSLECPNAFSPQGSEGINDEWRVSYRSIVQFQCWIFNRWGVEMCHLTDPSQGWDGRYKGKYVKSGTYFYVIEARGSDGREYKLKGDINILNYSGSGTTTSGEGDITQ